MRSFKRFFALLLGLLLLVTLLPPAALAEDDPPAEAEEEEAGTIELVPIDGEDASAPDALPQDPDGPEVSGSFGSGMTWSLSDAGVLTVTGSGSMPDFEYEMQPWSAYNWEIHSIVVKSGITRIGEYAFSSSSVKTVSIPSTVKSIGECAFESCTELSSVTIPSSVTTVDDNAFYDCTKLSSVTLNEGLKTLGFGAFCYCDSLKTLSIPASVTEIRSGLVDCSSALYSIQVSSSNANYKSVGGVLFSKDGTILCAYPGGLNSSSYTVPSSVTELEYSAFSSNPYLKSLTLPSGLQIIGAWAFACTSLTSITLPASVNDIGSFAFDACHDLSAIQVNSANADFKSVDGVLFSKDGKHLKAYPPAKSGSSYSVPSGVTHIEEDAFAYAVKLKSVSFPSSLQEINDLAFSDCIGLRSVSFPSSLTFLGCDAFTRDYDLSSITFTGNAPELGDFCFDDVTAAVYYPAGDGTWSQSLFFNCGGDLLLYPNVSGRPAISTQPKSVSAEAGSTAKFTVAATGSSLNYQWQWRKTGSEAWTDCSSATTGYNTATLSVSATSARNGYRYRCRISNSKGAVFSDTAVLSVSIAKPSITTQPKSLTAYKDTTAKFTVAASGSSLSYQWQWRKNSSGTWADSSATGANTATLSITAAQSRNGYQYRCKVSNSAGTVFSSAATLTVSAKPVITTQPKSQTVTAGGTAKFTVTAAGASSYRWQWRKNSSGTWADCSSATAGYNTATLSVGAAASRNGYQYRCKVSNSSGTTYSSAATLTVISKPTITTQPKSLTAYKDTTAKFTVAASGGALSYQWQWRKNSSGTWADSSATGAKTATLSVTAAQSRNGYQYRCRVKNSAGTTYSSAATLTVSVKPVITTQPKSVTAAAGTTAKFTVTAAGASSYRWQWRKNSSDSWADCSSATTGYNTATLSVSAAASRNGYQYRCKITNSSGTVYSSAVTLTVN